MKVLKSLAAGIACLSLVMALASCPSPTDPAAPPTPTASNNAFLSNLTVTIDGTTSTIGFQPTTYAYSHNVATTVANVTVNAVPADDEADFTGGGGVTLNDVGQSTEVPIVVTAANGTTKKTYTVTIKRAAAGASKDASLATLELTNDIVYEFPVDLSSSFSSTTLNYTAGPVEYACAYITVAATATDSGASISGTGNIPLAVGENTLNIIVTAADGITLGSYEITVTRNGQESSALASLTASDLSLSFQPRATQYDLVAPNTLASTTIQASAEYSGSTVTIDTGSGYTAFAGSATVGLTAGSTTTVKLKVVSEFSHYSKEYAVNITRAVAGASSDAALASLTGIARESGDELTLSPAFDAAKTSYTASVPSYESSVNINASAVAPMSVKSGTGYHALSVGQNAIEVMALAADGVTTKTYTVTVTRAAPPTLTITSPAAGSTITAGTTTFTGTLSDPNGEAAGLYITSGLAMADAELSDGTFSVTMDTSLLSNGAHVFDFLVIGQNGLLTSLSRTLTVQGGAEGHTASIAVSFEDGRTRASGYLSVAYGEESLLVRNVALSNASMPYQLDIPDLPDGAYKYLFVIYSEEPYVLGEDPDMMGTTGKITVNGADVDAGTAYLSADFYD